jgi:AraC-like DNA-binding protein
VADKSNFEVAQLAETLGLSVRQTERLVKTTFGQSPRKWLLEQRMSRAATLLRQADSIKEIAYDLSYSHPSHFNRHFKQRFGVTPTDYILNRVA